MPQSNDLLIYAHIGDLHLTTEPAQNVTDLDAIVTELSTAFASAIDFVYLPGDNADNGLPSQYALAARHLSRLPMPVHIVTGDHDMEPGSLDHFYSAWDTAPLPKAVDAGGVRCLFLDICGPGRGGPDFRIGAAQQEWLTRELAQAADAACRCAIFMHTYPADLKGDGETSRVNQAFAAREVLLVDMGHTHYNELANDGRTIYAATRSTGQIEEGPAGYSIVTIDGRTVSWRFRTLGDPLPLVLITAPADRRLAIDPQDRDHHPVDLCEVRASVLGPWPIVRCECHLDGGAQVAMSPIAMSPVAMSPVAMSHIAPHRYAARIPSPISGMRLRVEAEDASGNVGHETIELAGAGDFAVPRHADGSDADAVGVWEERGILGTQLGPNRNGRKW